MTRIRPRLAPGPASLPTVGAIILANDMVSESELRRFLQDSDVGVYATRVPCEPSGTAEALAAIEEQLEDAARTLLPEERVDAIVFSCTSGSAVIGPTRIEASLRRAHPGALVVTPLVAAAEALHELRAIRIGLVTPYRVDIHQRMVRYYQDQGFAVEHDVTFDCPDEAAARRVSGESLLEAARMVARDDVDAVFVSCTALVCSTVIEEIERSTGRPVVTSNQASAWKVLRALGRSSMHGIGRLMRND